jgi:hypothetical protein
MKKRLLIVSIIPGILIFFVSMTHNPLIFGKELCGQPRPLIKFGYKWKLGNVKSVKFWEDI